jgi:hypothetical protein
MSLRKPIKVGTRGKKLILRYNAAIGKDPLPKVRELARDLKLEVLEVDDKPKSEKRLCVVYVRGDLADLRELERQLLRFPAITVKLAGDESR